MQSLRSETSDHLTPLADCAKQTWRSGGVSIFSKVRALYSGSAVNIVLITPEKAIKLVANDFFRHHLAVPGEKTLSAWRGMAAGGLAGMFQIIVTTPMELLKIQMQDQGRTAVPGQKKMTALELTSKLLKERGIAGLYKGLGSTFARDVTFSMMYFPLFAYLDSLVWIFYKIFDLLFYIKYAFVRETLHYQGPRKNDGSGDAVFWTSFVAGLTAGASSSFAVTPLDGDSVFQWIILFPICLRKYCRFDIARLSGLIGCLKLKFALTCGPLLRRGEKSQRQLVAT
ncbi:hypothetical protein Y032_0148g2626 [Ancylostoma ceylanicum]|uniref:Uncharacterized protein n=1 Tax=Ancylostoma ceylanicum TaxID=53326 RepID=A0A016T1V9_9BILA|nr:hypothetical protein Y032_0148g2626 [Ancylostoma ceylanicum]